MTAQEATLTAALQQRFPTAALGVHRYLGQETVLIRRDDLLQVGRFLRDDPAMGFDVLMDLSAVDYLKFGQSQSSSPTLKTPSPLPYYMKPKPAVEPWERLPAPQSDLSAVSGTAQAGAKRQAGLVSNDEYRFDVVYHFYSTRQNLRLRVKVPVPSADPVVDSVTGLWASANWFEREVWDMFGITFAGHPNLRRLLMYEEFVGHPLRKDYPVNKRQPLIGPVT